MVLCAHWKQFKALAISALPCFVYITSSFQRSFLTRKLSNMRAVICIQHGMHYCYAFLRRKAETERRTVKILKKQTYHLTSPWTRQEKVMIAQKKRLNMNIKHTRLKWTNKQERKITQNTHTHKYHIIHNNSNCWQTDNDSGVWFSWASTFFSFIFSSSFSSVILIISFVSARYVNKQKKKQAKEKKSQDAVERLPIGQRKKGKQQLRHKSSRRKKKLSTRLENLSRQELIFFFLLSQRLSDGMGCVVRVFIFFLPSLSLSIIVRLVWAIESYHFSRFLSLLSSNACPSHTVLLGTKWNKTYTTKR